MLRELATVAVGLQVGEVERVQLDIAWERRFRRRLFGPTHHRLAQMRWATFALSLAPWDDPHDHTVYCVSERGILAELLPDTYRHKRVVRMLGQDERSRLESFLRDGLAALLDSYGEPISGNYWVNLYR